MEGRRGDTDTVSGLRCIHRIMRDIECNTTPKRRENDKIRRSGVLLQTRPRNDYSTTLEEDFDRRVSLEERMLSETLTPPYVITIF